MPGKEARKVARSEATLGLSHASTTATTCPKPGVATRVAVNLYADLRLGGVSPKKFGPAPERTSTSKRRRRPCSSQVHKATDGLGEVASRMRLKPQHSSIES